jgi:hypothetical protein
VKEKVMDWLNGLVANFYDEGIVKPVQHLDNCPNHNGDYVKKLTYVVSSRDIKII